MGILVGSLQVSLAQTRELLDSDLGTGSYRDMRATDLTVRRSDPKTLSFSPGQPFFDDFSYASSIPDSNLWFLDTASAKYPNISIHAAINPPSLGSLVFDGANPQGEAYIRDIIASGTADELVSHYIDLSAFGPGSNIALSFFLQPQGRGNAPERDDVFKVWFRTNRGGDDPLEEVLRVPGEGLTAFKHYVIQLDRPEYFHDQFQLIFQRTGSLNGYLDQWHLDYVLLGANRPNPVSIYNDRSISAIPQPPLAPYTAVPYPYFLSNFSLMNTLQVAVSNMDDASTTSTVFASISDPVGANPIVRPEELKQTLAFPPLGTTPVTFNSTFGNQSYIGVGSLNLRLRLDGADDVPDNNVLEWNYPIDSVFAYDDGEADASYGLNQSRGYGLRFDLPGEQPDTLEAIWISFVPRLNPTLSGNVYMKDRAFRIVVWNDAHPDSILIRQVGNIKLKYGDQPNHFERYAFNTPVEVPATFWVGVEQLDELPLGVGFDLTYNQQSKVYWDSSGVWMPSQLPGTLMIRPEMKTEFIFTDQEPSISSPAFSVYPNPITSDKFTLRWEDAIFSPRIDLHLRDLLGREVWRKTNVGTSQPISVRLPYYLPNGPYILELLQQHKHPFQKPIYQKLILNR